MLEEIWKDVPGEPYLQVSDLGNVRLYFSLINNSVDPITPIIHNGYYLVNYGGKSYRLSVLVAKLFIDNPNNLPQVNHKNGNKLDNRSSNLEWCTSQENTYHSIYTLGYTTNLGKKKVRVIKDGVTVLEAPTVSEAARFAHGQSTQVSRVLSGKRRHYKGYHFEYI